jgi:hypothetical protein
MYIRVAGGGVSLEKPEDTGKFSVSVGALSDDLDQVLRAWGWGMTDGAEALINVQMVQRAASGRVTASWSDDFKIMIDYARSRGWLSSDERFVRAHVETDS